MNRIITLVGAFALAVIMTSAVLAEDEKGKKEKPFNVKAFMKKAHAKEESYRADISAAIKGKDWDKAGTIGKEWFTNAQKLTKIEPKKGDKESWEKLSGTYCKTVKTLT